MSIDDKYLTFSHKATKSGATYQYFFYLSSPNNFARSGSTGITIPNEFVTNLGEIERGFEDEINIGLELTGTCKITFNLKADLGNGDEINEFRRQILAEQAPYTVNNVFFGDVRIPMRCVVRKGGNYIFDGVMSFKTQHELKITKSQTLIDIEFTDIARAAAELCRFDDNSILPIMQEAISKSGVYTDGDGLNRNIHAMALVNRYIAVENVVHHVLLMPAYVTVVTPKRMFECLGRFLGMAFSILTRFQVNPTQLHFIGQAASDENWICFDGNPFNSLGTSDLYYVMDNPLRGWTFHTQEIYNSIDGPEKLSTSPLAQDKLFFIGYVGAKNDDNTYTYSDGFLTNGKDGGNLGTFKNLYEFIKAWCKSFYWKVITVYEGVSFHYEVRSPFDNITNILLLDISKHNIEGEYSIKRGALASNFKVNLSDASNGNENEVTLMNGSENDTTLEHEVSIQSGSKFVNTADSNIEYDSGGWNYIIKSSNPFTCLYYDGTSDMNNYITKGLRSRMLPIGMGVNWDHGITTYYFKVNEKCFLNILNGDEKVLIDKPELPNFITAAYGGEGGDGYFDDASATQVINEGDARRDAKYDQFNSYQSETLNTIGQPTLINKWNQSIYGDSGTELIEVNAYGANISPVNIGQLILDSSPLGISALDSATRFGVLTKIVDNPMDGSLNLTILAANL